MKEKDVITLAEDLDYLLVSEINHDNEKYFLAMGIDQDNIYAEDHCFFKVGEDENGEFVEEVEDEKLINKLYLICATEESLLEFPELADKLLEYDKEDSN